MLQWSLDTGDVMDGMTPAADDTIMVDSWLKAREQEVPSFNVDAELKYARKKERMDARKHVYNIIPADTTTGVRVGTERQARRPLKAPMALEACSSP